MNTLSNADNMLLKYELGIIEDQMHMVAKMCKGESCEPTVADFTNAIENAIRIASKNEVDVTLM